jgi:peptidoglycan/LPS O-acetylase OafA/YrhL
MEGREHDSGSGKGASNRRSLLDWALILTATGLFVILAVMATRPQVEVAYGWAAALIVAMLSMLALCGAALWKTTRFR